MRATAACMRSSTSVGSGRAHAAAPHPAAAAPRASHAAHGGCGAAVRRLGDPSCSVAGAAASGGAGGGAALPGSSSTNAENSSHHARSAAKHPRVAAHVRGGRRARPEPAAIAAASASVHVSSSTATPCGAATSSSPACGDRMRQSRGDAG